MNLTREATGQIASGACHVCGDDQGKSGAGEIVHPGVNLRESRRTRRRVFEAKQRPYARGCLG